MAIPPTDINWIEKYGNMDWGNAMKTGDFGLTDAERDSQLQRTIAINNQEMARLQAKRAAEQAAVNQPAQGAPMPGYRPAPMMGGTYPYQIPNRNFTWQTTPQEQMALAGRMNRQDLQPLLGSGEYGPLAGQQYRYTPQGTTQINYGPGGGSGFGGLPPWQTQPIPLWQPPVPPTIGDLPPVVPPPDGRPPVVPPIIDGRPPVVPPDWTPGPVPEGEEWNFRPEDFRGPLKDWTAPVNPYGTTPQGYQTREQFENMQRFQQALADPRSRGTAATPLAGPEQFGTMPTAAETAARQAAATAPRDARIMMMENQRRAQAQAAAAAQGVLPGQLDRTVRAAPPQAVTGVDRGLQQAADAASRAAAQRQRAAVIQSQQREESRGREAQEERVVQAQAKETRQKIKAQQERSAQRAQAASRAAAAKRTASRQAAADRSAKAAQAKRIEQQRKTREQAIQGQAAATKAMEQARAKARNKKAEASRKKAMGSKNYSAYQARGKR